MANLVFCKFYERKTKKIQIVKKLTADDKLAKEALKVAKNFKILTYPESYTILEPRLEIDKVMYDKN